jgi:hypothetical protein
MLCSLFQCFNTLDLQILHVFLASFFTLKLEYLEYQIGMSDFFKLIKFDHRKKLVLGPCHAVYFFSVIIAL